MRSHYLLGEIISPYNFSTWEVVMSQLVAHNRLIISQIKYASREVSLNNRSYHMLLPFGGTKNYRSICERDSVGRVVHLVKIDTKRPHSCRRFT